VTMSCRYCIAFEVMLLVSSSHLFLNCASFWHKTKHSMTFQVVYGRPLCSMPSTYTSSTQSLLYFRSTRPNHLNLPNPKVPRPVKILTLRVTNTSLQQTQNITTALRSE